MNQSPARSDELKELYRVQRHIREMYNRAAEVCEDPIKHLQKYRNYIAGIAGATPDPYQQLMMTEIDFTVSFSRGELKLEQAVSLRCI